MITAGQRRAVGGGKKPDTQFITVRLHCRNIGGKVNQVTSDVNSDVTCGPRYLDSSNFLTLLKMTVTDKHPQCPPLSDLLSFADYIYPENSSPQT